MGIYRARGPGIFFPFFWGYYRFSFLSLLISSNYFHFTLISNAECIKIGTDILKDVLVVSFFLREKEAFPCRAWEAFHMLASGVHGTCWWLP